MEGSSLYGSYAKKIGTVETFLDPSKPKTQYDLERLNKGGIEKRRNFDEWSDNGEFLPLHTPPKNVYVDHHMFHAVCSCVGFKQLREAGEPITIENISISKCT